MAGPLDTSAKKVPQGDESPVWNSFQTSVDELTQDVRSLIRHTDDYLHANQPGFAPIADYLASFFVPVHSDRKLITQNPTEVTPKILKPKETVVSRARSTLAGEIKRPAARKSEGWLQSIFGSDSIVVSVADKIRGGIGAIADALSLKSPLVEGVAQFLLGPSSASQNSPAAPQGPLVASAAVFVSPAPSTASAHKPKKTRRGDRAAHQSEFAYTRTSPYGSTFPFRSSCSKPAHAVASEARSGSSTGQGFQALAPKESSLVKPVISCSPGTEVELAAQTVSKPVVSTNSSSVARVEAQLSGLIDKSTVESGSDAVDSMVFEPVAFQSLALSEEISVEIEPLTSRGSVSQEESSSPGQGTSVRSASIPVAVPVKVARNDGFALRSQAPALDQSFSKSAPFELVSDSERPQETAAFAGSRHVEGEQELSSISNALIQYAVSAHGAKQASGASVSQTLRDSKDLISRLDQQVNTVVRGGSSSMGDGQGQQGGRQNGEAQADFNSLSLDETSHETYAGLDEATDVPGQLSGAAYV